MSEEERSAQSAGSKGGGAADDLRRRIHSLGPWFHNLHLPGGVQTAPDHELGDFPAFKWAELRSALPGKLRGWSALDIGCNAGYYSFQLARRGATVLGIDHDDRYLAQARWARERYGLDDARVSFRRAQVYEIARWNRRFDLVLFLGIFYHLRYPLLALDAAARTTKRLLLFQSLTMPSGAPAPEGAAVGDRPLGQRQDLLHDAWPKMAFVEGRFASDPTNWWVPNPACVEALLRAAGLEILERPHDETFLCRPHPSPPISVPRDMLDEEFGAAAGLSIPSGTGESHDHPRSTAPSA